MARPAKTRTPEIADDANHEALEKAGRDAAELGNQLALVEQQYDVGIPYNKDVYISTLRQYAVETATRVLHIGFMLMQLHEHETREDYLAAVERIGFSDRFAQRAVQAAKKLRNRQGLIKLGSSKALELLAEDDDALDALENGGTLAGATLDEIDCMTVRELRAALRKKNDKVEALDRIIKNKDAKLNEIDERSQAREAQLDPDQQRMDELVKSYSSSAGAAMAALTEMDQFTGEIYALRKRAGHAFKTTANAVIGGNVEMLAAMVGRLQQYGN